ncbi:sensor histidine kinase [Pseudoalteromonas piscicida]|uniref:Sensor histidine kinase n=1 Tax=Pseudoalteromonas piscicida TaxID=43662 RepID=A0AAQ2ES23_PSEO7|nr:MULTISPECIES: histidine kinase [Pseudoalteromonas]KJY91620.1 ATPase [Pseudoalteromonas piscicida]TMN40208.1 sensor histidine kinase [Pseudoalteromonas piscicida]TMN42473.1 sensor histidine kinase [Pseudoalteromonas piscicida]TMN53608.1 sensor histidine kinase [Pseudoalteromonas piscicida]TMN54757.1 sensor histidine kinase [Pseudoalteromonas piscicida]
MVNLTLQRNEQFAILAIVAAISFAISLTDWVQRGMLLSANIALSSILAVVFLYWLPMVISYVLIICFKIGNWPLQYIGFYGLMVMGCLCWGVLRSGMLNTHAFSLFEALTIALPWSSGIFVVIKFYLSQKLLKQEKQLRQLAEIKLLHSQLNPHFMFNSLNTIAAFVPNQPEAARSLVHNLAAVLRYSLTHSVTSGKIPSKVSVANELIALNQWCEIEQSRFGDALIIDFDIDDALLSEVIPPMILQPLLENAVKHGNSRPLHIDVLIKKLANQLMFKISDNGVGFKEQDILGSSDAGLGLSITRSRLKLEENAELRLGNDMHTGGAVVSFSLTRGAKEC